MAGPCAVSNMFRRPLLLISIVLGVITLVPARTKPAPPVDPDYVDALTAANSFLHAWQAHDAESGILLLTDNLRERTSAETVAAFFSAIYPQQAYEISRGRKLSPGRYQFPVTLWHITATSGASPTRAAVKPHLTTLIISRDSKADWLVDKLP